MPTPAFFFSFSGAHGASLWSCSALRPSVRPLYSGRMQVDDSVPTWEGTGGGKGGRGQWQWLEWRDPSARQCSGELFGSWVVFDLGRGPIPDHRISTDFLETGLIPGGAGKKKSWVGFPNTMLTLISGVFRGRFISRGAYPCFACLDLQTRFKTRILYAFWKSTLELWKAVETRGWNLKFHAALWVIRFDIRQRSWFNLVYLIHYFGMRTKRVRDQTTNPVIKGSPALPCAK